MSWWIWLVLPLVVIIGFVILQFNRMTVLRNRIAESWSNIDTELKRRHELIPNLVATVKGYATHEAELMKAVTRARTNARKIEQTGDPLKIAKAEGHLAAGVDRLLAVAERYPELKASKNFLALQQELAITEDRIQAARRFYNGNVRSYHNQTQQFPGNMVAGAFGFKPKPYFQVERMHMANPGVKF